MKTATPEPAAPVVPLGLRGGVALGVDGLRAREPRTVLLGSSGLEMAECRATTPSSGAERGPGGSAPAANTRREVALVKLVGLVLALAGSLACAVVAGAAALWWALANAGAS